MVDDKRPGGVSRMSHRTAAAEQTLAAVPSPKGMPEIERTVSELGAKVAKARAERGWSLATLAERAGLSTAAVHKIEKSGMTPTIASLMKVAAALGKSVGYFVEEVEATRPVTVVRADERTRLYTSKQGLELQNISGRYGPFWVAGAEAHLEPLADSGPEPMSHPGEELVLLLEGRMTFTIDGESYKLDPGASTSSRIARPPACANPDKQPARAIWLALGGSEPERRPHAHRRRDRRQRHHRRARARHVGGAARERRGRGRRARHAQAGRPRVG